MLDLWQLMPSRFPGICVACLFSLELYYLFIANFLSRQMLKSQLTKQMLISCLHKIWYSSLGVLHLVTQGFRLFPFCNATISTCGFQVHFDWQRKKNLGGRTLVFNCFGSEVSCYFCSWYLPKKIHDSNPGFLNFGHIDIWTRYYFAVNIARVSWEAKSVLVKTTTHLTNCKKVFWEKKETHEMF